MSPSAQTQIHEKNQGWQKQYQQNRHRAVADDVDGLLAIQYRQEGTGTISYRATQKGGDGEGDEGNSCNTGAEHEEFGRDRRRRQHGEKHHPGTMTLQAVASAGHGVGGKPASTGLTTTQADPVQQKTTDNRADASGQGQARGIYQVGPQGCEKGDDDIGATAGGYTSRVDDGERKQTADATLEGILAEPVDPLRHPEAVSISVRCRSIQEDVRVATPPFNPNLRPSDLRWFARSSGCAGMYSD